MPIETKIEIAAPASRVWVVLTDFPAYRDWNPFIKAIEGKPEVGARLRVRIQPPGRPAITFRPTVLKATPNRELRWIGRLLVPGLFDGEHAFQLEDQGLTCVVSQSERFSGILVAVVGGSLFEATRAGFEEMNVALKARAEGTGL